MDEGQLRKIELPGYWTIYNNEPISRVWVTLWIVWGLIVAALMVWSDGTYLLAGCFVAWGMLMGVLGIRLIDISSECIRDWAKKHCTDADVERAAWHETFEAFERAKKECVVDETDISVLNTPTQQKWNRDERFAVMFCIPWSMGLIHGVGIGGLLGAVVALNPAAGVSVTTGAVSGAFSGATMVPCLDALLLALIPLHKFTHDRPFSLRQRLLLLISPMLAIPALVEAAVLWWRWSADRRSDGTIRPG